MQRVEITGRADRKFEGLEGGCFPYRRIGHFSGTPPVDFTINYRESVNGRAARVENGSGGGIDIRGAEGHLRARQRLIGPEIAQGGLGDNGSELLWGANRDIDGIAELGFQMAGELGLHLRGGGLAGGEYHVAARDEGGDVADGQLFDGGFEVDHLDTTFAEIDAVKKSDV